MRIVCISDTHNRLDKMKIPPGDLLLHAGDLTGRGSLDELRRFDQLLATLPHRHKVIIAGNHDWGFQREPAAARELIQSAVYLQDSEVTIQGLRIYGSPWQPWFLDWAFNGARGGSLKPIWDRIPAGIDILITHGPPAGIGDHYSDVGRQGCEDLRARIGEVKPRLHLFGHIHQDGGFWQNGSTFFANVTTWECERAPTVLELDPQTRRVVPVDIPPARRY